MGLKLETSSWLPAAAISATWSNRTYGEWSTTPYPRRSIPRLPALPVSCVLVPGLRKLVAFSGELGERFQHNGLRRHVDPERQRLGGEHRPDQAT